MINLPNEVWGEILSFTPPELIWGVCKDINRQLRSASLSHTLKYLTRKLNNNSLPWTLTIHCSRDTDCKECGFRSDQDVHIPGISTDTRILHLRSVTYSSIQLTSGTPMLYRVCLSCIKRLGRLKFVIGISQKSSADPQSHSGPFYAHITTFIRVFDRKQQCLAGVQTLRPDQRLTFANPNKLTMRYQIELLDNDDGDILVNFLPLVSLRSFDGFELNNITGSMGGGSTHHCCNISSDSDSASSDEDHLERAHRSFREYCRKRRGF